MASLGFTPAKEQDFWIQSTIEASPSINRSLSGKEVRQFYENLTIQNDDAGKRKHRQNQNEKDQRKNNFGAGRVSGSQTQRSRVHARVSRGDRSGEGVRREGDRARSDRGGRGAHAGNIEQATPSRFAELNGLKLLRCAKDGDVSAIKDLLSRGTDINFQDSFLWTAMMCACWAGQRAAVRLLLQQGAAWVGVVDTQGKDAMDLARTAGHPGVVEELQSYGRNVQHLDSSSSTQAQLCNVCGSHYSGSLSSHLSSTLHQFSLRRPPPTPHYCLPPSSASYKMMVRCGWDPATGLGPQGGGPVRPVPTVLKRDHKGLGYGPARKAKVTHFLAKDPQAVKPPLKDREQVGDRGKRKEAGRRQEEIDKTWERDFRASFYL